MSPLLFHVCMLILMIIFGSHIIPVIRCLIGIHYLDKYPFKSREIGSHTTYHHYFCHRCKKEIIR